MSARLEWRPTRNDWQATDGQSVAASALARAFGGFPNQLSANDLPVLRGMLAVAPADSAWKDLIDAIERHHTIDLQVCY